jgi:5S rRNA maturation endonuclease (ribonuclease M5)
MQETPLHPISLPIQIAVHLDHPKGKIIRKRLLQTLDGLEELFPKLEQYSDNEKTKETITYIQEHFTNYIDLETE